MGYTFRGVPDAPRKLTEGPRPAHWAKPGPKPKPLAPFDPALCGSMKGYRQHRRNGMEQCQPCKDANTLKSQVYKQERRAA
jgi:hypothetical protein